MNTKRESIQRFPHKTRVNVAGSGLPMALIMPTNQAPAIQPEAFLSRDKHLFVWELPTVGHIPLTAHVRPRGRPRRRRRKAATILAPKAIQAEPVSLFYGHKQAGQVCPLHVAECVCIGNQGF